MELTRRLRDLEKAASRRQRFDPRPLAGLMISDPAALDMGIALAELMLGDDPLPRDHPDVREAWARLESRLNELRAAAPFAEKCPQNPVR